MSWIDRLNEWALKRVLGRQVVESVAADGSGINLTIEGRLRLLRWSDIEEIAAMLQPDLSTGSLALAIRGPGTSLTLVSDSAKGFKQLCEDIPRYLADVTLYPQWALELIAAPEKVGKVIFRRVTL